MIRQANYLQFTSGKRQIAVKRGVMKTEKSPFIYT